MLVVVAGATLVGQAMAEAGAATSLPAPVLVQLARVVLPIALACALLSSRIHLIVLVLMGTPLRRVVA